MARPDRERFIAPKSQGLGMAIVSLVPSDWFCGLALCCVFSWSDHLTISTWHRMRFFGKVLLLGRL